MFEFNGIKFDWDENKHFYNQEKHGINFYEAATVFNDNNAIYIADDEHSESEERFIVIGVSIEAKILIVCHCYRESDTVIRLFSARKAEKKEIDIYKKGEL